MKEIEAILNPITGYLSSISRNTENGYYELEIGIPKNWVFNQNNEVGVEIISENDAGKLLKIFPKKNSVVIDDLILFVHIIINTNERIATKEKEFADKMEEMKKSLERQASDFYKELDELKDNSFKKLNDRFTNELNNNQVIKKERKPRTPKNKVEVDLTQFKSPGVPVIERD